MWRWGGRDGSNSISDAEQLLCILMPATQVTAFNLDRPDETAEEMIRALRPLGNATEIPRTLIGVLREYFTSTATTTARRSSPAAPTSPAAAWARRRRSSSSSTSSTRSRCRSRSRSPSSVSCEVLRSAVRREETARPRSRRWRARRASGSARRWSACCAASPSTSFDVDTQFGQALIRTVNQANLPQRQVVAQLRRELRQTIASLPRDPDRLRPGRATSTAPTGSSSAAGPGASSRRRRRSRPTSRSASSPRAPRRTRPTSTSRSSRSTRSRTSSPSAPAILGLLNDEQQRLVPGAAAAVGADPLLLGDDGDLRRRPAVAAGGHPLAHHRRGRVRLLHPAGHLARGEGPGPASAAPTPSWPASACVLTELANRARITRRPFDNDPALDLHSPGVQLDLVGSEELGDTRLTWTVSEFAALLLQRTTVIAGLLNDAEQRGKLLELGRPRLGPPRRAPARRRPQPQPVGPAEHGVRPAHDRLRRSRPGTTPNASCRAWSPRPTC